MTHKRKHLHNARCCITRDSRLHSNQEMHSPYARHNANKHTSSLPSPPLGSPHTPTPTSLPYLLVFRIWPPICSTSPYLIVQNDTFTFYGEPIILSYTVRWLCKPTCPDQLGSRGVVVVVEVGGCWLEREREREKETEQVVERRRKKKDD